MIANDVSSWNSEFTTFTRGLVGTKLRAVERGGKIFIALCLESRLEITPKLCFFLVTFNL